ncbi:MAG: 16S rRNA (cytidine(1402)-2'-O)-methyltransferase [Ignavibacteria bacterium]
MEISGKLYVITTPIGNYADMTIRGLRMLEQSSIIVCEEFKEAAKLLKHFGMRKELMNINEHNENESTVEVIEELQNGKTVSLISDCGTPGFSDPGNNLLNECFGLGIKVELCGGANSVMTALVLSGFDISRFYFRGFLSPKKDIRREELNLLRPSDRPVVIMEAPYRLNAILEDISDALGARNIFVGFDLSMQSERQYRGRAADILRNIGDNKLKGEFVIIIDKS